MTTSNSDVESSEEYEEMLVKCNDCHIEMNDNYGYFTCILCKLSYCYSCQNEIEETYYCSNDNCYHCRRGNCFNTRRSGETYCEKCAPEDVKESIEQHEKELLEAYDIMAQNVDDRRNELQVALQKMGLELREDSRYCKKYIEQNDGDVDEIVNRMCEMKFLFDYCDMRNVLDKVEKEHIETLEAGYFPDSSVFDEAEYEVLGKTPYPKIWPWLN